MSCYKRFRYIASDYSGTQRADFLLKLLSQLTLFCPNVRRVIPLSTILLEYPNNIILVFTRMSYHSTHILYLVYLVYI